MRGTATAGAAAGCLPNQVAALPNQHKLTGQYDRLVGGHIIPQELQAKPEKECLSGAGRMLRWHAPARRRDQASGRQQHCLPPGSSSSSQFPTHRGESAPPQCCAAVITCTTGSFWWRSTPEPMSRSAARAVRQVRPHEEARKWASWLG